MLQLREIIRIFARFSRVWGYARMSEETRKSAAGLNDKAVGGQSKTLSINQLTN